MPFADYLDWCKIALYSLGVNRDGNGRAKAPEVIIRNY